MAPTGSGAQGDPGAPYLLCFDGSESAERAIRSAGEITGGGPALVVHAWLPPSAMLTTGRSVDPSHPLRSAVQAFDAGARRQAGQVADEGARIAREAGFDAEPLPLETPHGVWRPIVKLADERNVRAIVAGSHGLSAVKSTLMGSVSRGIANHATRPVIVVPPEQR